MGHSNANVVTVGTANRYVELLSGDGERVRRRAELVEQKNKLEEAIRVLAGLGKDGVVDFDSDATMHDVDSSPVQPKTNRR